MSENALGGADEIRTSSVLSSQRDENGSRIGQGDPSCDGRPAGERRTLEVKEEKDAAKEAFNGGTLSQFLPGPGRWQAGAVLLPFGVPGHDGNGSQGGMEKVGSVAVPNSLHLAG